MEIIITFMAGLGVFLVVFPFITMPYLWFYGFYNENFPERKIIIWYFVYYPCAVLSVLIIGLIYVLGNAILYLIN